MQSIALDDVDQRIADALAQQSRGDFTVLTKGADAMGLLLRLPEGTKGSDVDFVAWADAPNGRVVILIEAKDHSDRGGAAGDGTPVFGSCKGMLSIVAEDDDHLKDFAEYMK